MLKYLAVDRFTILLVLMVLLASILPITGQWADGFNILTTIAIAILFFLHGAKLSREAVIQGILHWRLHSLVFAFTFIAFPLLGLLSKPILQPLLGDALYLGFLFLCFLPSTVQSSIAFTSVAGGNAAGAVCSASFSNIIGMFITPIMVSFFILGQSEHAYDPSSAIIKIVALLLVPFILGQLLRTWIYPYMLKVPKLVKAFDQGSILMVVYGAFLLAFYIPKWLGFNRQDQITIFFCGSKKTLASGVPMAQILFAGQPMGMLVLPIMIFHQIQLMVCGVIAAKWSKQNLPKSDN